MIEGLRTFALGHLALGYLTGKATSRLLDVKVNVSLFFLLSIVPDFDLLIPGLAHRGPTHSLIVSSIVLFPGLILYGKGTFPYFASLISHSLFGDLLTGGGVQLMWPVAANWYGAQIPIMSLTNISLELAVFIASMTLLLKTRDVQTFFRHHPSNMFLTVPVITIILPAFVRFPMSVPLALIFPHLVYLILLSIPVLVDLEFISKKLHPR